jgi:hypothetical protein
VAELTLEPYAVVQQWRLPTAEGHWEGLLAEYLQTIARRCAVTQPTVIGHIKALALFSDKSYLRVSVVAPNVPASVTGKVPVGCTELELTLNVLVYGLERTALEQITLAAAREVANQWKGDIHPQNLEQAGQPSHHSNPQDQKERHDE